jgi:hypothetical protein
MRKPTFRRNALKISKHIKTENNVYTKSAIKVRWSTFWEKIGSVSAGRHDEGGAMQISFLCVLEL